MLQRRHSEFLSDIFIPKGDASEDDNGLVPIGCQDAMAA